MTTTLPRAHRTGEMLHAVGAALLLTVFVVGAPAALVALAPLYLPDTLPTWSQLGHALTSPDDGSLLMLVLALVGWVAWAGFTACVVLEIVAGLRRISTPTIPLLGSAQWAASRLVASAGILLAVTTTVATPSPAAAAPGTVSVAPRTVEPHNTEPPDARHANTPAPEPEPVAPPELPSVVVQRGDTLWDLAEHHLGDGVRFTEISTLNLGRPQPDGRTLTDSHWIYPGWTLLLPADATGLTAAQPVATSSPEAPAIGQVVVEPGDNLWTLAEDHLGDGDRYQELYAANAGKPQPDGGALTDPNLIEPGWRLDLPVDNSSPAATPATVTPEVPAAPEPERGTPRTAPLTEPAVKPAPPTASATPTEAPDSSRDTVGRQGGGSADASSRAPLFVGLTALAAAGVVGELSRRRHLQHRARRVGESIPMPATDSDPAAVEQALRHARTPVTLAQLKVALQNIDTRCYTAERDLPRITAISLDEHTLTLHLQGDDPEPVPPFAADGSRWTAATSEIADDALIEDSHRSEPYPALVPLGHTEDATVLLNLEAAGTLSIVGDDQAADDVLRALVVEIITSDLTGRIALVADEAFAELAAAFEPARMHSTPDHTRPRKARAEAIAAALEDSGLADTLEARSDRILEDTWLPVIYLEQAPSPLPTSQPWTGSALITRASTEGWTLTVNSDGTAVLDPLSITLRAQRLSAGDLEHVTFLLLTAQPPVVAGLGTSQRPEGRSTNAPDAHDTAQAMREASSAHERTIQPLEGRIRVNVLGPIQIDGLAKPESTPPPRATELLVYLALRRTATGHELDEVFWPGKRDVTGTRNTFVYRTRQLIGDDALPTISRGEPLRVTDDVTTDWAIFQELTAAALATDDERLENLTAAMELVRGRPFLGIDDAHYGWAENDIQVMVSAIADTAHLLARIHHEAGRYAEAIQVATHGLRAEPLSALLQRDAIDAADARGDHEESSRLRARFASRLAELDPDAEL
ncbi:LysM peptidoglycan-binding domain-containing protein [uncultured Cellulomonas sp.]|uniref:LysM peptidoglycan-binding domain-containing protein n=1 Tax=uncultured Cellulomonas sp. TaxID=189682 RepID=UPI0028E41168|nr:LysM peptidoglycan-binding domain-containing protein [uncultured Cellulomonas sp.]